MKTKIPWIRNLFRKKLKYMLLCVCIVGVIFVLHQLFYFRELNHAVVGKLISGSVQASTNLTNSKVRNEWDAPQHSKLIRDKNGRMVSLRGTRDQDIKRYLPNNEGKFICFKSGIEIDFIKINDNYCDCPMDGSDEPGTNACNTGIFHCELSSKNLSDKIASYKVNDGYCDCCDGSDEWLELSNLHSDSSVENTKLKCPNKC